MSTKANKIGSIYNIMPMVSIYPMWCDLAYTLWYYTRKGKKPTPVGIGVLVGKDKHLVPYTNTPHSASHRAYLRNRMAWLLAVVRV